MKALGSSSHRLAGLYVGLVTAASMLAGCSPNGETGGPPGNRAEGGVAVPVLAARAEIETVPVQLQAIGNVVSYSRVVVRSQVTGQLKAVHFQDGQTVKRGDLLFTIDPRPFEATLQQTRANLARDQAQLENAQLQFNRSSNMFASKLISQEQFDNARASLDAQQGIVLADQAAITNAELNLEYTTIRAPVDGVAGARLVFVGNIIKAVDDQMVVINQIHPLYVSFAVPEQSLPEIRRELREKPLKVTASFDQMEGSPREGELTFIDNTVDRTTGTIQLKGTFPNEDNALWPGQFVQVTLTLSRLSNAVVVPTQAVQTGQNGEYIYVVKSDQTVEMRPVKIGIDHDGHTVVMQGIRDGETVVTDGQLRLTPGAKVTIKSQERNASTETAS